MGLVSTARLREGDLAAWERLETFDRAAWSPRLERRAERAQETIRSFVADHAGRCYLGVSWGKDSVVVAHLAWSAGVRIPYVYVEIQPLANPDCALVRDVFLSRFAVDYHNVQCFAPHVGGGRWNAEAGYFAGFTEAERIGGAAAYVSGVRAQESGPRMLRCRVHGTTSKNTCAPLAWWSGGDVFAYLARHDLPIHPNYAMSFGGRSDRIRLRVDALGMRPYAHQGTEFGRDEWERTYYRYERSYLDRGEAPPRQTWEGER